jgi:predicted NACHT family NTPase
MAKPTLTASIVGKEKANAAFKRLGKTQDFVAGVSGTSRQLVSKFLNGLSVEQPKFIAICEALELRWQEIAELDEVEVTNDSNPKELELLVQEVKQKITADVTERCGTMRVLDMTQPVDLDRIYTDVNIVKNITARQRIGYDEVMELCTREHFDRFLVGTIQERVAGFVAVEEFQKLVVLGKPGAGKTTFMKYLAMSCLADRFHGELVPIFVTLKAYAEERGQPTLENYILTEFQKREVAADVVKRLLKEGRALILLDGLDEVKKEDDRRVKQDIDQFSRDGLKNRFAITCRIAAREYQFEKFTEVEVADFDDGQIKTFVNNWFRERDELKAERLLERLKDNKPVKELATNPLLLTLLCLVFGERNDFPPKRSELYKEGLEVLMKKWDANRNIEREIIYKHLSPQNKEDMLGQIAFNTFVNGEYFFRQEDLQRQIKDYICNLPEASADPEALRLDSEVVLKAIEHHHGLLVERARNIYSFSHLTFQEYFAAKAIERGQQLKILVQNISNPRWKEVFYLTAEMLWRSDDFLQLMKDHIDGMLADDEMLQSFLEWTDQKTNSVRFSYKTVAVRVFYGYVGIRDRDLARDRDLNLVNLLESLSRLSTVSLPPLKPSRNRDLALNLALNLDRALDRDCASDLCREIWQVCIDSRNIDRDWQFTEEQLGLLNQYYEANLLLAECMNRSYVSKQVREEIESTMLLPSKK